MKKSLILISFVLAGCQSAAVHSSASSAPAPVAAPSAAAPAAAEGAAALLVRLRKLTADNACTSDAQCMTVPIGARACGGPEAYLAYSTANGTDPAAVTPLAQRFSAARAVAVKASGELSTCIAITDPGALCLAQVCQLRAGSNDPR